MLAFILLLSLSLSLASLCLICHSCVEKPSHRLPGKRDEAVKNGISCPRPLYFLLSTKAYSQPQTLKNELFSTVTSAAHSPSKTWQVLPWRWWWWWWWFCWLFSRPTGWHAPNSASLRLVAESSERRLVTSWLADWMAPSIRWASCLLSSIIFRILPWEANPHRGAWCQGSPQQAAGPLSPFISPRLPQFRPHKQNTRWRRGKKIPSQTPLLLIPAEKPNHYLSSVSVKESWACDRERGRETEHVRERNRQTKQQVEEWKSSRAPSSCFQREHSALRDDMLSFKRNVPCVLDFWGREGGS